MDPSAILTCIGVGVGALCVGFALGRRSGVASATDIMEVALHLKDQEMRMERMAWLEREAAISRAVVTDACRQLDEEKIK